MAYRGLKITSILAGAILALFLPQLPSCMMANAAKYGSVIDANTGKGIPDVTIIAAANIYAGSAFGGGDNIYRVITHTDADGKYFVPAQWFERPQSLPVRLPGANAHIKWLISALKPGYALSQDEEVWKTYTEERGPSYVPISTVYTPPASLTGFSVKVEPLKMQAVEFNLNQAAIYYRAIYATGYRGYGGYAEPEEVTLRKLLIDKIFEPRICSLAPDAIISGYEIESLIVFAPDERKFKTYLYSVEPEAFQKNWRSPVFKPSNEHPILHAKNVCEAIKLGGERS